MCGGESRNVTPHPGESNLRPADNREYKNVTIRVVVCARNRILPLLIVLFYWFKLGSIVRRFKIKRPLS